MATFEEVLREEREYLWGQDKLVVEPEGVGLAFSGGGIRSATFNLGILQGLAKAKLLDKINYLSTVSGGGYIGGWLISWILREPTGISGVQNQLGEYPKFRPQDETYVEPKQVNFLRDYSNYMTPRLGIFGADTWAGIATYLRNVMLNQLILIALLGTVVFLPWCVLATCHALSPLVNRNFAAITLGVIAGLLLIWAVSWASVQCTHSSYTKIPPPHHSDQRWVLLLAILPLFCSAILTMFSLWLADSCYVANWHIYWWIAIGAAAYGLAHTVGVICRYFAIRNLKNYPHRLSDPPLRLTSYQKWLIPISAAGAGAVAGLFLKLLNKLFLYWKFCGHGFAHAITWGPLLFVGMFLFIGALHIGLLKILIQNEEQEWWGRAGGLLLVISVAWTGLFALTIFVPWLFATEGEWVKTKVGALLAWAATTAFGVLSGKSSKTSGKGDGNPGLEIVALVSPYVFILGMMILLSSGAFWIAKYKAESKPKCPNCSVSVSQSPAATAKNSCVSVPVDQCANGTNLLVISGKLVSEPAPSNHNESSNVIQKEQQFWNAAATLGPRWVWSVTVGLFLIAALLAWRVDINIFSMNLLYRNRLVRCYLGASRKDCTDQGSECVGRRPNPFTGFDPNDDVPLAIFRNRLTQREYARRTMTGSLRNVLQEVDQQPYTGPFPILCGALNVTHGEKLGWQERKAESFAFTPLYCGYDFQEMHKSQREGFGGYQPTEEYAYPKDEHDPSHPEIGGVRLGTAISISGAAASPNMGYHTSPPLAFLMTMFDVRLGWWLANSRYQNKDVSYLKPKGAPRWSLVYLLKELFASTTDESRFVYLSDGGHFENLAVYELVRRRCKFIIACDADADENVLFGDLGNTIRKCRSDFGVEITLDPSAMQPNKKNFAELHGVIGTIDYPPDEKGAARDRGYILYIKPTITKDVPRDVLAYRDTHAPFPNQTTADQWFDESQFESYRRLGLFTMQTLAGILGETPQDLPRSVEDLFVRVRDANEARKNAHPS
jgi:hypothetical protein